MAIQDERGALTMAERAGKAAGEALGKAAGEALGKAAGEALGKAAGLRVGIEGVCALLAIELTAERRVVLETMNAPALEALFERLKHTKVWEH